VTFISWTALARLVERAAEARFMFKNERNQYREVVRQLRDNDAIAGRICTGCGGSIMERELPGRSGSVTFKYDCSCVGGDGPCRPEEGWRPVQARLQDISGGLELEEP
jgi:hypothetical protein